MRSLIVFASLVLCAGCHTTPPILTVDSGQAGCNVGNGFCADAGPDAATAGPDAATPGADAAEPGPDAATPGPDAGPTPDGGPALCRWDQSNWDNCVWQ